MRYSSAVVLSTLAVGQAAAANAHNRHASFHARREAAKRGDDNVDWKAVAYDLKDVKWDKVNWSSVFASSATPTPTPEQKKPVTSATPTPEPKETPSPSSTKPAETPKPSATPSKPSVDDKIVDVVDDVMAGVAALADSFKYKIGTNAKTASADNIWIGKDGKYGMDVTNIGTENAVWYCWVDRQAGAFTAPFVNANTPDISVGIAPGKTISLSFPEKPTACSPLKAGLPDPYGMIMNTWAEAQFSGSPGVFDVSRNPNMQGSVITMKGSKCTSDYQNCVFRCKDPNAKSCKEGADYELFNCGAHNGGQSGFNPAMGGVGGGCEMGSGPERLKVTFT
ncbi:hypothetical protein GQ44DRAFT_741318 [Phaeosphaeriaceae sp. PMI808]|nr:hypothetical protein GQ44DRAFT_741318 [Phaeosphaeriaceae sp. PMI808]